MNAQATINAKALAIEHMRAHTGQVLGYRLGEDRAHAPVFQAPPPGRTLKAAESIARAFARRPYDNLVLAGLGTLRLLRRLDEILPQAATIMATESDPDRARDFLDDQSVSTLSPRCVLLADTSAWAVILLLARAGVRPDNSLIMVNPELPKELRQTPAGIAKTLAHAEFRTLPDPDPASDTPPGPVPELCTAAILAPGEPDLDDFFSHAKSLGSTMSVVWDGPSAPDPPPQGSGFARHLAHPLDNDFSAQRNRMLSACEGEWTLVLDADERLEPGLARNLDALTKERDINAFLLPRQTLYPDRDHFKTGYGLWPDLQTRLFRNTPALKYQNPIHERLTGVKGAVAIVLDPGIIHLQGLRKTGRDLEMKLAGFDQASSGRISHKLSSDYPSLPRTHLPREARGIRMMVLGQPPGDTL